MSTTTAVDPRVGLTFATRDHDRVTHWIEGAYPEGHRPDAMIAEFEAAGWVVEEFAPPCPAIDFNTPDPTTGRSYTNLGYKEQDFHLTKKGSELFLGWSEAEKKANISEARAIMRRYGFTRVPTWRKTLADML